MSMALWAVLCLSVQSGAPEVRSEYVTMDDGVRLAVDVYLPAGFDELHDEPLPALFELTRYWRATEDARTGRRFLRLRAVDRAFLEANYALVKVDMRGSGASFGTRLEEYGPAEVEDGYALVDWAVEQLWCSGAVGAYGTSYTGTTAEFLAACNHPAVKAVIPGWSDFDAWRSPIRPYGLMATGFLGQWSQLVGAMDRNDASVMGGYVARVDGDGDAALRNAAVAEHAGNPTVLDVTRGCTFRDEAIGASPHSFADISSRAWREEIEESGVPMLVFASWFDAGTAEGALRRLQHYSNPQRVIVLASNHGGGLDASPYGAPARQPPTPHPMWQVEQRIDWFDHYLKGVENGVEEWPALQYFNVGEEAMREAESWPVPGVVRTRWHLVDEQGLTTEMPRSVGEDAYDVDFGVTTGTGNRWYTQLGAPVSGIDDRAAMNTRMLCYTTEPLVEAVQITGTPTVQLRVTANRDDGMILVYLEDVAPDGRVRNLSEGGLRGLHRRITDDPDFDEALPFHSFAQKDALPMNAGEPWTLECTLWPISVRVAAGHRLRLAIAGADADTFDRLPEEGDVTWTVGRGPETSWLDLPVVPREE